MVCFDVAVHAAVFADDEVSPLAGDGANIALDFAVYTQGAGKENVADKGCPGANQASAGTGAVPIRFLGHWSKLPSAAPRHQLTTDSGCFLAKAGNPPSPDNVRFWMVATWYMRSTFERASPSLRAHSFSRRRVRQNWTSHFHHMISNVADEMGFGRGQRLMATLYQRL